MLERLPAHPDVWIWTPTTGNPNRASLIFIYGAPIGTIFRMWGGRVETVTLAALLNTEKIEPTYRVAVDALLDELGAEHVNFLDDYSEIFGAYRRNRKEIEGEDAFGLVVSADALSRSIRPGYSRFQSIADMIVHDWALEGFGADLLSSEDGGDSYERMPLISDGIPEAIERLVKEHGVFPTIKDVEPLLTNHEAIIEHNDSGAVYVAYYPTQEAADLSWERLERSFEEEEEEEEGGG